MSPDNLALLQRNLIRSHAAGVGDPLTRERTRMLLCLRINILSKGHSGTTPVSHSLRCHQPSPQVTKSIMFGANNLAQTDVQLNITFLFVIMSEE